MKNSLLVELTNKYIDNELSAEEQTKLTHLLEDERNKEYFNSMVRAVSNLNTNKPTAQKIDVKNMIVAKINKQKEDKAMNKIKSWWEQTFNGTKVSYAVSFALGAVFIAAAFLFQTSTKEIDDNFMRGTIANRNFDETYFLSEQTFEGAIKVKHSENLVILDVDLSTTEALSCELTYDKNLFALYGVKSMNPGNGKFASGGNLIQLSDLQSNHYMVFLRTLKGNYSKVHAAFYNKNRKISNLTIELNY